MDKKELNKNGEVYARARTCVTQGKQKKKRERRGVLGQPGERSPAMVQQKTTCFGAHVETGQARARKQLTPQTTKHGHDTKQGKSQGSRRPSPLCTRLAAPSPPASPWLLLLPTHLLDLLADDRLEQVALVAVADGAVRRPVGDEDGRPALAASLPGADRLLVGLLDGLGPLQDAGEPGAHPRGLHQQALRRDGVVGHVEEGLVEHRKALLLHAVRDRRLATSVASFEANDNHCAGGQGDTQREAGGPLLVDTQIVGVRTSTHHGANDVDTFSCGVHFRPIHVARTFVEV